MMRKKLSMAWFFLWLGFTSVASSVVPAPLVLPAQSHFIQQAANQGDIAENPDEHVQESIERFFSRKY